MAQRKHTNPNGRERFEIRVELSHVNAVLFARSYAGITILREVFQATPVNIFDPSTWSGGRWIRSGNPRTIFNSAAFLNVLGTDISNQLAPPIEQVNNPGYFELFFLYYFFGSPQPSVLGTDARSVRQVRCQYSLPWEDNSRTLEQA